MEGKVDIDWARLAMEGGWIFSDAGGLTMLTGAAVGRDVLMRVLDPQVIESATRAALAGGLGAEAAKSVLMLLRPRTAIESCIALIETPTDPEIRIVAADLLATIATEEKDALEISLRLLGDPEPAVALGGLDLLERRVKYRPGDLPKMLDLVERCSARPEQVLQERSALLKHAYGQPED